MAINKTSIVIFSSGNQEHIAKQLNNMLTHIGYECVHWRSLFTIEEGRNNDVYALLPTLLKKIPTFDFSIIIAAADDISVIQRSNSIDSSRTMRDNLIFETGLSVMALGQNKTILVADERVRFIDDFIGCEGADGMMAKDYPQNLSPSQLGVKCITFKNEELTCDDAEVYYQSITTEVDDYISSHKEIFDPIVIGASCSSALGYYTNFIERLLHAITKKINICIDENDKLGLPSWGSNIESVQLDILMPNTLEASSQKQIQYYEDNEYRTMHFPNSGVGGRHLFFRGKLADSILYIVDIPSTISTSYETATKLLSLKANDREDIGDKIRFIRKEMLAFSTILSREIDSFGEIDSATININSIDLS